MKPKRFIVWLVTLLSFFTVITPFSEATILYDSTTEDLYKDESKAITVFGNSGDNIMLSQSDIDLMAKVVFAESNLEPYDGKVGVASVILNRLKDSKFPNTIKEVILQKSAFSCVKNGDVSASTNDTCYRAVLDAIKGVDPTDKAMFFYNPKIATSKWMFNVKKINIKKIGQHVFFNVN
ncbi:cell wall hydrolase [Clostridium grantii]|uniref:N-acetylmuramoyl-L-alanine amidase n=1 Tax=Clostridium grantii DSM 8605 TaxID=1121316 RepID=A0A1M5TSM9_9CLOT|nr:cell wall hydrolase [Clostridium grantii]SHH53787.1 N-acetylmuramoyl-L-alanine amidase [Clostridium grantii DSM 8605]